MREPVRVVYDDRYVTREETPPTVAQFIKQRTRWSQGFLQTLLKGEWKRLPTFNQRLLAFYTLAFPSAQAVLGVYVLSSLVMMFTIKTPGGVAIILDLPFYLLLAHFLLSVIGLFEFTDAHGLKANLENLVDHGAVLSALPMDAFVCGLARHDAPVAWHQQLGENETRWRAPGSLFRRDPGTG